MPISTRALRVGLISIAALSRALAQEQLLPVYFNHTTIWVGEQTYDAFKASPLLADEFGAASEKTTKDNGGARVFTGFYVFGLHTYFELFKVVPNPPSNASSASQSVISPGQVDLGMWIDHRTLLPRLRDRLLPIEIRTNRDLRGEPNFDLLRARSLAGGRVATWVSAHYPEGHTRDRKEYQPDRLFHDVVAYTVTVSAGERNELLKWFHAYGYTIKEDGDKRIATGPDFIFTILPEPSNDLRTATIEMTLNREKTGQRTYSIGDAELKFNKSRATLTFRFPKSGHAP